MNHKIDYIKIIKIAAGAGIAIALAEGLGLKYSTSAGVITLLSIQDTKKETIRVMTLRLCSFMIALALAAVCFWLFGYGAVAISVFLLFFSGVSFALRMQEGISVNTVLMTHFMAEQSMSVGNVGNELALLTIGAGIGVLMNLYIPGKEKQIRAKQQQIEARMRGILGAMAGILSSSPSMLPSDETSVEWLRTSLDNLETELKAGEKNAYEEMENKLVTETRYYLRYMNMRQMQSAVLGQIAENLAHLSALPSQSEQIARLIGQISGSFHEHNNAVALLAELEQVKADLKKQPLPDTRAEIESRAVLYRILLELEQFLRIKMLFVKELSEDDIKKFWKASGGKLDLQTYNWIIKLKEILHMMIWEIMV